MISTGRGGRGNLRSPSRDASRGPSAVIETSPVRSELRGRGYDRDAISLIDSTIDGGVVREIAAIGRGCFRLKDSYCSIRLAVVA